MAKAIYNPALASVDDISETSATFLIEPLHPGYGNTLGNSLRRVLLSSVRGGAVVAFRIEGATHEFTTVEGIKEDVVDIMLNLKNVHLRVFTDDPVELRIEKTGAGEVTAAIAKGVESAKKNLTRVPVLKGTVPHEQSAKFGGAEVFIKPASHGTGVVAGGAMRAVLESVGVTDVLAKSKGSSNPHNLVKATILALSEMRDARMVAQNRGVSMEKVFRG